VRGEVLSPGALQRAAWSEPCPEAELEAASLKLLLHHQVGVGKPLP
jgi:hypothetical protein